MRGVGCATIVVTAVAIGGAFVAFVGFAFIGTELAPCFGFAGTSVMPAFHRLHLEYTENGNRPKVRASTLPPLGGAGHWEKMAYVSLRCNSFRCFKRFE